MRVRWYFSLLAFYLTIFSMALPLKAEGPNVPNAPLSNADKGRGYCSILVGWLKNIPTIRKVGSRHANQVIFTISGQSNVPEFTLEEAHAEVQTWINGNRAEWQKAQDAGKKIALRRGYKEFKAFKEVTNTAILQFQTRVKAMEAALAELESGSRNYPILLELDAAPSIEAYGVELHQSKGLKPGPLEFRRKRDLLRQISKEKKEIEQIEKMQRNEEIDQAIRHWQLSTFLKAFRIDPETAGKIDQNAIDSSSYGPELRLYLKVQRLLDETQPENADLLPRPDVRAKVDQALVFDQLSANQWARRSIEKVVAPLHFLGKGFQWVHKKFDSATTPMKIVAAGTVLQAGLAGGWYLVKTGTTAFWVWLWYNKEEREEMEKNEELIKRVFFVAGTSRNLPQMFDRLYDDWIQHYRDESIELATEYMLGNRPDLQPDGKYPITVDPKTGATIDFYKEAREIVDFFGVMVVGKKNKKGEKIVDGAGDRMDRRDQNWNNLEQLRVIAEQQGLLPVIDQFGTVPNGSSGNLTVPSSDASGKKSPLQQKNWDNMQRLKEIAEKGGLRDLLNGMGKNPPPPSTEPKKP